MAEEYTVNFNLLQDATRTAVGQGASTTTTRNDQIQNRKDNAAAAGQRQKSLLQLLGINITLAALLKSSQIFTNFLGALFQVVGAAFDIILAQFAPVLIAGLTAAANFLPQLAQISNAVFPRLLDIFRSVGQGIASIAGALGNMFRPIINLFDKDGVSADGRLRLSDILQGLGVAVLGPGIMAALRTGASSVISATVFSLTSGTVGRLTSFVRGIGFTALIFSGINILATFREAGLEAGIKALGRFFVTTLVASLSAIVGSMFGPLGTIIGAGLGTYFGSKVAGGIFGDAGVGVIGQEINTGGVRGGRSDYGGAIGAIESSQMMYPQSSSADFIGSQEVSKFGIDRQSARLGTSGGY